MSRAASAMGTSRPGAASSAQRKTYFEQQRELLLGEIAMSFEQVLANINKLNRSLEAVVTVGNEFSAVEALWSQFEGVMGKEEEKEEEGEGETVIPATEGEEHHREHEGAAEADTGEEED